MMKKLTCILAALAMLIWTYPTQAAFKGDLKDLTPFTIEIDNTTPGRTAVTVYFLSKKGGVVSRSETVEAGLTGFPINVDKLPKGTVRIVILVAPPEGGEVTARVIQGAIQTSDTCTGDKQLVFDVVL